MSLPEHEAASEAIPPAVRLPAALRRDGAAPRSLAERLFMLGTLLTICLAVAIPTAVVTRIFGQRAQPKAPPAAVHAAPVNSGLLSSLQHSADQLLPAPTALGAEPITLIVRPEHVAARLEKVRQLAVHFGGIATEGVPRADEKQLFVDLPAAATGAFRAAVTARTPLAATSPSPTAASSSVPAPDGGIDHVEVIIRAAADDE